MIGPEMDHLKGNRVFGVSEYSTEGKQITNYSSPDFVGRRHTYQIPGGIVVSVTIQPYGFDVCIGQQVIGVQYDPNKSIKDQPMFFLLGGGYLVPTPSV